MKAIWNKEVIAESNETILIEGNHYFPPASVKEGFFTKSRLSRDVKRRRNHGCDQFRSG